MPIIGSQKYNIITQPIRKEIQKRILTKIIGNGMFVYGVGICQLKSIWDFFLLETS